MVQIGALSLNAYCYLFVLSFHVTSIQCQYVPNTFLEFGKRLHECNL